MAFRLEDWSRRTQPPKEALNETDLGLSTGMRAKDSPAAVQLACALSKLNTTIHLRTSSLQHRNRPTCPSIIALPPSISPYRASLGQIFPAASMLSASVEEGSATMSTESRKRSAEPDLDGDLDGSQAKRKRIQSPHTILTVGKLGESPYSSDMVTLDELAKKGLRRSISLALETVGFDSAAPEAMESFAAMAESCMRPRNLRSLGNVLTMCFRYSRARQRHHGLRKFRAAIASHPDRLRAGPEASQSHHLGTPTSPKAAHPQI